jgi:hypothetical protein
LRMLWDELLSPWLQRMAPVAVVCGAVGILIRDAGAFAAAGIAAISVGICFLAVRPLLSGLPLSEQWTHRLVRARVLPAPAAIAIEPS